MTKYLLIALGGALGSLTRFLVSNLISSYTNSNYPWGTFFINISGSFIIGFLLVIVTSRLSINDYWRLALAVGFTGAYTTFSTFEYEVLSLFEKQKSFLAITYIISSVIIGFLAVWSGSYLAKELIKNIK